MRLHNRQIKSSFWTDPDILQWPRDKRWFYMGLIQLADDSGCLEDSSFAFKLQLYPSPVDADITVETIEKWRDELVEQGKLVPYEVDGKPCLYLKNFHKHQKLSNCPPPDVPLPPWVRFEYYKSNDRQGKYIVSKDELNRFLQTSYSKTEVRGTLLQNSYDSLTTSLEPNLTKPNLTQPNKEREGESASAGPVQETERLAVQPLPPSEEEFNALPPKKQLDMMVSVFKKNFPLQVKEYGTKGIIKARDIFENAVAKGVYPHDLLVELWYWPRAYADKPNPPPWEIVRELVDNASNNQNSRTWAYCLYTQDLQAERGFEKVGFG